MQSTDMTCNFTSGQRAGRRKGDANYVEDVIYCSHIACDSDFSNTAGIVSKCLLQWAPYFTLQLKRMYYYFQYLSVCNDKW